MPPGWYDDPWSPAAYRWWDGAQWTPHVAARMPVGYGFLPPPSVDDVAQVARSGQRASIAAALYAASLCVQTLLLATLVHGFFHRFLDQIRQFDNELDVDPNAQPHLHLDLPVGHIVVLLVADVVTLAAQIIMVIWLFKAARTAERLRLPKRLDPIWAILGFILPVINFWFPYWIAADLLPPGDPRRPVAGWWWAFWLAQGVTGLVVFVVSFTSSTAAVVLAVLSFALPIGAAIKFRELVAAVSERHAALVPR